VLDECLHRYSVGIILTPAPTYPAIVPRSCCQMLMKNYSDLLVVIVLRIVLRTVLKSEQDRPGDHA